MIIPPFSWCKAWDHHVACAGQTDREGIVAPGPRAYNPAHRRLCGLPVRENPWQQACETEAGEEQRIGGRHRKVAGHACPSIPSHHLASRKPSSQPKRRRYSFTAALAAFITVHFFSAK